MSESTYKVFAARNQLKKIINFSVCYINPNIPKQEFRKIPDAVIFPVNDRYDEELQKKRAFDYANYLNKLDEAAKVAYDQIHLIDVLTR